MLPLSVPACRGLLVTLTLAALAGCYTEEDARLCQNVTCSAGYCIAENGKPVCHCDAWSQAAGLTCAQVGLAADDTNDIPGLATPIEPSAQSYSGKFDARPSTVGPDVDFYSFRAQAGHVYLLFCVSEQAGCAISLSSAESASLVENSGTPWAQVLRELNAGRHTFRLKANAERTAATYQLRLEDLGPDDHGDTPAEATTSVPSSEPLRGRAEDSDDVDVFSFTMTAGHIYTFDCSAMRRRWWLTFRDGAGVPLATSESSASSKRLVFEATSTGKAFAELHTAGGTSVETYTCSLKDLGPDDHGDTVQTASVLMPGTASAQGRMETQGDKDFFRFTAAASHFYHFRCGGDCTVSLYDSAGTSLLIQRDWRESYPSWIFQSQGASDLFLSVSSTMETYSYELEDLGTDYQGLTGG